MSLTADALMWSGITPPNPGSAKTFCPQCNPTAYRQDRKSMSVYAGPGMVTWRCHRCGWEDFAILERTQ